MQVYFHPDTLGLRQPVVSIGIFDGVHRGHRNLLNRVRELAFDRSAPTLAITFWPHPRLVLGKADTGFRLLTGLDEKIPLLRQAGMDNLLVVPFTPDFAAIPATEFVDGFINRYVRPSAIVVGDDLRFGAGGSGNIDLLRRSGREAGFEVIQMETHTEGEERISSTRIRNCLLSGDLETANSLLGYPYFMSGTVVRGNRVGSTIGFPTANLECPDPYKQIPADGVYAVRVEHNGNGYGGMMNIGFRPTLDDGPHRTIEVHLFGAQGELYHESLRVNFIARIRDEMKFDGIGQLKERLETDRQMALQILKMI